MSRQVTPAAEKVRSARRMAEMKQKGGTKAIVTRSPLSHSSPPYQPGSRSSRRGHSSHDHAYATGYDGDEGEREAVAESSFAASASIPRGAASSSAATMSDSKKTNLGSSHHSIKRVKEKKRTERKASVRKESFHLEDSDSELTDAPEEEDEEGENQGNETGEDDSDSDGDMARRLQEAGDGESLLGSAISDRGDGDTDEEEERYIIEDIARRQLKAMKKRKSRGSSIGAAHDPHAEGGGFDNDLQDVRYDGSGSLSPETLQQLGLDGYEDDIFAPQEPFHSSSEPSFSDFFGSDSDDDTEDGLQIALKPRVDDDQLTTDDDDDDSMTEISDLDEGMLSAPFLAREALAAGASTQVAQGAEAGPADIPLLVIEDLDGRLIYARAGDGEAVFGSDGEFEFVDDSDEDDTDEDMDGLGSEWTGRWGNDSQRISGQAYNSDDGDTTDELPDENMPFPRLLVGSVAPNGGRNARRARAMAAKSRGRSLKARNAKSTLGPITQGQSEETNPATSSALSTPEEKVQELDFSISTEALARDPQGTLEAAAKSLGLMPEEVARLVTGIQDSTPAIGGEGDQEKGASVQGVATPISKPQMGSFIPSSFKSVRRAVIDGNRQAPSPFTSRYGMQKKGLANRKRHPSESALSSKRIRRHSNCDTASQQEGMGEETSEMGPSSPEASPIDPMDLDDVLDASMLWRGQNQSSPPSSVKTAGLNLNAFARWHRIPMGAFRDGQGASGSSAMSQQPLGSFLLTRANRNQQAQSRQRGGGAQIQSPFRGRAEGDAIHLGAVPHQHDAARRSDAFMISPILWPTNRTSVDGYGGGGVARMDQHAATPVRKLMTRREKRQRKARKAALKATTQGNEDELVASRGGSPGGALTGTDATSASLPRLSITDASPSPHPNMEHTMTTHSSPLQNASGNQPPSSVFGVPLHSPLFSGILNPPNLGFRDDLEERDEEGILTI